MIYVEAPGISPRTDMSSLFIAGGISGCSNWQEILVPMLNDLDIVIFNPRRDNFPIHDPNAAQAQIEWEFNQLTTATVISFWFCKETLCPIVLYELGRWAMSQKPIVVGMDPDYQRHQDVEIQMDLARPGLPIVYSLKALATSIRKEFTCRG